jgi:hypothetical protein
MNPADVTSIRLESQHVAGKVFTTPQALLSWMCAMQAQDFPMAKWAIGIRLPGSTDAQVEAAIEKGAILRTHLLRPTWHFVSPQDIYWLLDLTAPQIIASQRARDRQLELAGEVYRKSNRVIEAALRSRGQLSREALIAELNRAGIATDQNRASHLLMRAELEKIVCSGATLRGKPTYALLAERVPKYKILAKEEALAQLARRYFASRCPATLQDFSWWSGLPARDARQALDLVRSEFIAEQINGVTYFLPHGFTVSAPVLPSVCLLPTYDEIIISYADRSASIPPELGKHMKEISDRGVFWPVVLENGSVKGTWKRTIKKDTIYLELQPFAPLNDTSEELIRLAAQQFADFWGKRLEFVPP